MYERLLDIKIRVKITVVTASTVIVPLSPFGTMSTRVLTAHVARREEIPYLAFEHL